MIKTYIIFVILILTSFPMRYPNITKHSLQKRQYITSFDVFPEPLFDKNHNKIHDLLEVKNENVRIIITLRKINENVKRKIAQFLENPRFVGRFAIGTICSNKLFELAKAIKNEILFIEPDQEAKLMLFQATKIIGVRPYVWFNATGKNVTVAIIDSGVDASHRDLANKIIYWYDVTGEYEEPVDPIGHGTFVASIIAGSGISSAGGIVRLVIFGNTSKEVPTLLCIPSTQRVNFTIFWKNMQDAKIVKIVLEKQGTNEQIVLWSLLNSDNFSLELKQGFYRLYVKTDAPYAFYVIHVKLRYYNFDWLPMRGVAPQAKLVVIKCASSTGKIRTSWILEALEKIREIARKFGIRVVNLSLGVKYSYALETAVNDLAKEGIIVVTPAGNEYLSSVKEGKEVNQITTPGTARFAITVGGINDLYGISIFSSRGGTYKDVLGRYKKPDVVAPAGGLLYGSWITAADSSFSDGIFEDAIKNDYISLAGTSASAAIVSGIIADFLEKWLIYKEWHWNLSDVSMIKAILMASTFESLYFGKHETEFNGITRNPPSFDLGDKDYDEGYGIVWAPAMFKAINVTYVSEKEIFTLRLYNKSPVIVLPIFLKDILYRITIYSDNPNASIACIYTPDLINGLNLEWSKMAGKIITKQLTGNKLIFLVLKLVDPHEKVSLKIEVVRMHKRALILVAIIVVVAIIIATPVGGIISKKMHRKLKELERKIEKGIEKTELEVKEVKRKIKEHLDKYFPS